MSNKLLVSNVWKPFKQILNFNSFIPKGKKTGGNCKDLIPNNYQNVSWQLEKGLFFVIFLVFAGSLEAAYSLN